MRRPASLALAAALAAAPAGGAAAAPYAEFTRAFQAGVDAYRLGKLGEARAQLERARDLEPRLAGPHRFLAAVARADGRFVDCIDAARRALALNPRSRERGDTRRLHEACRTAAGRAPFRGELGERAAIAVTTSVAGAAVRIDGLGYGSTPVAPRPIPAGAHAVEVAKPGYRRARVDLEALPGIVTDVTVELVADPPP